MITGAQIRAARAALGWSAKDLATYAKVGLRSIVRFEATDEIPPSRTATLIEVQTALEAAGVEFTGMGTDRLGIRFPARTRIGSESGRKPQKEK